MILWAKKQGRAQSNYHVQKPLKSGYDTENFRWTLKNFIDNHHWGSLTGSELIYEIIHKLEDYHGQTWATVKQASGGKTKGTNNHFILFTDMSSSYKEEYIKRKYAEKYEKVFSL